MSKLSRGPAPLRLSRRTFLRGAGGVAVGLPVLEAMLPGRKTAWAQDDPGAPPRRYCLLFAGQAIGGDRFEKNESIVRGVRGRQEGDYVVPQRLGADYDLTTPLRPLSDLDLMGDFSFVSNQAIPYMTDPGRPPEEIPLGGAFNDFHGGGCSPLLSGTRSTEGNFRCNGPTPDQIIAQAPHNAGATTFESLVLRSQPQWYLAGSDFAGRQYISYREGGRRNAVEAQTSPQAAFNALFGGMVPDPSGGGVDPAVQAAAERRQRLRRSVLDVILGKRDRLLGALGAYDRRRIERHFDELRDLERRIGAAPPVAAGACRPLADPGPDPVSGGVNTGSGFNPGHAPGAGGIQPGTGYSDEDLRTSLFTDLIAMAFTCDLTRSATLQITVFQSHMNVIPVTTKLGLPVRADLHEVGHNGDIHNKGQIPVSLCLQWHISHFANLVRKLKDTPEAPGTPGAASLLDSTAVVFMPEAGHGRHLNQPADEGNFTHSVEQMMLLVAGRAGGLSPGRHIDAQGAHPAQTLVSAMQAVGVETDSLGEVTGNRAELFG